MCYTGLFKRFVPFVLTFAAGLFVASFFVSIALPEGNWRNRRSNKFQEMQRLRVENENLRQEMMRLKMENDDLKRNAQEWAPDSVLPLVPPVDFDEHHPPPPPPKRPKQPRFEINQ